jgi:hypothetical protein
MAKTDRSKKKRSEKTVYTYKEYVEKLRPKSLGSIEGADNTPTDYYEKLTLGKSCALRFCDHPIGRV